jgi:predicted site-specific integrase-resolvase
MKSNGDRSRSTFKNEEEKRYISVGEASKLCGICPQTLRIRIDEGKIDSYRTESGQRKVNKLSILEMCHPRTLVKEIVKNEKINFIYSRVSSKKQLDDLSRQVEYLRSRDHKYSTYTSLQDVGSGINFKRKGLETILDRCIHQTIGEVVVAHRDRLSRFGFDLIRLFIEKAGGTITVIDDDEHKSSEQELSEDLLSIVQIYCCKSMGKRRYRKKDNSEVSQDKNKAIENTN